MTVTQSCLTLRDHMDYSVHGILQARILERVALPFSSGSPFPSPVDIPNPRIEPRSPALQAVSLPAQPQRKSEYMGVGSLSLLQQIFLTQELNHGLLHLRQILYQLSYQGSPNPRGRSLRGAASAGSQQAPQQLSMRPGPASWRC